MNNPKEKITIEPLKNETEYPIAYRLAQEIWDTTYKQILSPEQIKYMLDMMYAPEVIEKELKEGIRFEFVKDNGTPTLCFAAALRGRGNCCRQRKACAL